MSLRIAPRSRFLAAAGLALSLAACVEDRPRSTRTTGHVEVDGTGAIALRAGHDTYRVRTRSLARGGERVDTGVVEQVVPAGEGFEQSWLFEAPTGSGDLVAHVAVDDLQYVGLAECGARYRSVETNRGLCYGRATWVDAAGRRTAVPWSIDATGVKMRVSSELLESSAYPARLDPVVSPELDIADFALGPTFARNLLYRFGSARSSDVVAAVWQAVRTGAPATVQLALLDLDGALLTAPPIVLAETENLNSGAVAFDGTLFRVFLSLDGETRLYRVTPEGEVLDPGGVLVRGAASEFRASCESDGTCLLAYLDEGLEVARIAADGGLVAATPSLAGNADLGRIESTASGWRIAQRLGPQRRIATFPDDLTSISVQAVSPSAQFSMRPLLRDDGTRWVPTCSGGAAQVDDQYLRLDGEPSVGDCGDWSTLEITDGMVVDSGTSLQVLDRDGEVVAEMESGVVETNIELARLSGDAVLRLSNEQAPFPMGPDVTDLVARRFALATLTSDTEVVSLGAATVALGGAATHEDGFAVSFRDYREGWEEPHERIRFFDRDAEATEAGSFDLGPGDFFDARSSVATNGQTYLVAWPEGDGIDATTWRVRRFSTAGLSLDASPLALPAGVGPVSVASRASNFVALFQTDASFTALELPDASPLIGTPFELPGSATFAYPPVTSGDELWILLSTGSLVRFDGVEATTVPSDPVFLDLACSDDRCLGITNGGAAELAPDGTVEPTISMTEPFPLWLAWDGSHFVVTAVDLDGVVSVRWLDASGQEIVAGPTTLEVIDDGRNFTRRPSGMSGGRSLVIGSELDDWPEYYGIKARLVDSELGDTTGSGGGGSGGAGGDAGSSPSAGGGTSEGGAGPGGGTSEGGAGPGGGTSEGGAGPGGGGTGGAGGESVASPSAGGGTGEGGAANTGGAGGDGGSAVMSGTGGAGDEETGPVSSSSSTSSAAGTATASGAATSSSSSGGASTTSATTGSASTAAAGGDDGSAEGGGCSCDAAGAQRRSGMWVGSLALAGWVIARRRRIEGRS